MTGPGGENVKMKGKKFIAIMAIFIILCSIQAISALEDNNVTQTDVLAIENIQVTDTVVSPDSNEDIAVSQDSNESSNHSDEIRDVENPKIEKSSSMDSNDLLQISPDGENILGITSPGVSHFSHYYPTYGDNVPISVVFKAIFWDIRDYVSRNLNTAPREWDVFLDNKTFNLTKDIEFIPASKKSVSIPKFLFPMTEEIISNIFFSVASVGCFL